MFPQLPPTVVERLEPWLPFLKRLSIIGIVGGIALTLLFAVLLATGDSDLESVLSPLSLITGGIIMRVFVAVFEREATDLRGE